MCTNGAIFSQSKPTAVLALGAARAKMYVVVHVAELVADVVKLPAAI